MFWAASQNPDDRVLREKWITFWVVWAHGIHTHGFHTQDPGPCPLLHPVGAVCALSPMHALNKPERKRGCVEPHYVGPSW